MENEFRKLVTLRIINEILPIDGADVIEVAVIGGWKVVVKKNEFKAGDPCIYFEIDSFLPSGNEHWQFLVDKSSKKFEGKVGHRLRTIKLRKQISQGLILPVTVLNFSKEEALRLANLEDKKDYSEILGITKYEEPLPVNLCGQSKGYFPSFISKTDQERCQNLVDKIFNKNKNFKYEVTIKLDGSSMTAFVKDEEVGICSRNLQLKDNEENKDNAFVSLFNKAGIKEGLKEFHKDTGKSIALQGELMGPGVQGNRENLSELKFYIYDIYDIDGCQYIDPVRRKLLFNLLKSEYDMNIEHVPIIVNSSSLDELNINNVNDLLKFAEGESLSNKVREGVVFKRLDGLFSFKSISNEFLAKEKD